MASDTEKQAGQGTAESKADSETAPEPADDLIPTTHSVTADGGELTYTATTGRLVLRSEVLTDGAFEGHKPKAEVFLTAYVLHGTEATERPVTFCFNGGPGSSSVWLHLGLFGPRRVRSGDTGAVEPPPYGLEDNRETLLATTDLVFIDPVSTGYSRAVTGEKPGAYHGFEGDIESIAEVIRLWCSRNGRWLSPKFLAGESYGTLRAAGLAAHLQQKHCLYLNGLMLISSVLDFATVEFNAGNDAVYPLYLPTYAAIAHYHGLHGDRPLSEVLAEAEEFADTDYRRALARGNRLTPEERQSTVDTLARLTGLSADYVDRVNLRIEHLRFFTELLRERRLVVGRLDSRFTGPAKDYGLEHMESDPFTDAVLGSYAAAFNHYVREDLGYRSDLPYQILSGDVIKGWSYKEFENAHVTTADRLAAAMRQNEFLRVHVAFGYYDGGTPYYAAEQVLSQLEIPAERAATIDRAYYPAGHMMYVHEESRRQQSADLAEFIRTSSNR